MCGNPCKATGVKAEEILVESTGVIGQRIKKVYVEILFIEFYILCACILYDYILEVSALKEMLASSSRNAPIDETNPHEDSTNSNNGDTNAN
ncbi:unnamed protein product [Trifolium pratense]|uniref:Uncharacterized protein n=1 Tax=Trifolium pratense TaxID=57577 RepID=A0ACB0LTP7_TRIPR|nr:unnamed protein product [Trifolium pratense]